MQRSSVVLPEPDGPMSTTTSPLATSSETSSRTCSGAEPLVDPGALDGQSARARAALRSRSRPRPRRTRLTGHPAAARQRPARPRRTAAAAACTVATASPPLACSRRSIALWISDQTVVITM